MDDIYFVFENRKVKNQDNFQDLCAMLEHDVSALTISDRITNYGNEFCIPFDNVPADISVEPLIAYLKIQFFTEISKKFNSFIEVARKLAQALESPSFFASKEPTGLGPENEVPIRLLFFKDDEWLPFLQKHIKFAFDLDIESEKLKELVKEHANLIKEYPDNYKLISFFNFTGDKEKDFYKVVREMKNE